MASPRRRDRHRCFPCDRHSRRRVARRLARFCIRLPAAVSVPATALSHRATSDSDRPAVECSGHAKAIATGLGRPPVETSRPPRLCPCSASRQASRVALLLVVPSGHVMATCGDARIPQSSSEQARALRAARLLRFVHLSSQGTVEPVRQDGCFAEKQEPHPALVLIVRDERLTCELGDARLRARKEERVASRVREMTSARPSWIDRAAPDEGEAPRGGASPVFRRRARRSASGSAIVARHRRESRRGP
jgi:hypothetical protein